MTKINPIILVSSSYEGRDKSIIKSILNIDNHYGYLTLKYTEDSSNCCVFLTKKDETYFAILKDSQSNISIGTDLNPKTVISLFQHISESADFDILEQEKYQNTTLLEHVLKYVNSESNQLMEIRSDQFKSISQSATEYFHDIHILLNSTSKTIYSNQSLTPELQIKILNTSIDKFKINFLCENQSINLKNSISFQDFKWNLGLMSKEDIFHFMFKSEKHLIKQLCWPDYGHHPYQKEFLQLSSILNKHSLSYIDLIKITSFKEDLVNAFLNANILLNCLELIPKKESYFSSVKLKQNRFIQSLKNFFSHSLKHTSV